MDRDECVGRVRRICLGPGDSSEKLSHGEPTFFTKKRVFAMCSLNHHQDGRYAVVLPTEPGMQAAYLEAAPKKFYYPPYVGVKGWIGVKLDQVDDEELGDLVTQAWKFIRQPATKRRAGI
jgi:hypothetical protein